MNKTFITTIGVLTLVSMATFVFAQSSDPAPASQDTQTDVESQTGSVPQNEDIQEYLSPTGELNADFVALSLTEMQKELDLMRVDLDSLRTTNAQGHANMAATIKLIDDNLNKLVSALRSAGILKAREAAEEPAQ